MELHQGIILGIVQGLTEFLPVSSSGHLVLGQTFFGITESQLTFDISVHMGTLLAVLVVYFTDIKDMLSSVFRFLSRAIFFKPAGPGSAEDPHLKMAGFILLGSVPTAIIGLVLKKFEHILFSSQVLVGVMLILTGTILWFSRKFYFSNDHAKKIGFKKALLIGTGQGLAVLPGISRSGTTIALGMFLGLNRHMAAKFSFLLSIPAIVGAQTLSIKDSMENGMVIDPVTLVATLASFITGLVALKLLLTLVHSGRFHLFAPYCWIIGSLVLFSNFI